MLYIITYNLLLTIYYNADDYSASTDLAAVEITCYLDTFELTR